MKPSYRDEKSPFIALESPPKRSSNERLCVHACIQQCTRGYTTVYTRVHKTAYGESSKAVPLRTWSAPRGYPTPILILFTIILFTIMTTEEYQRLDLGYIHCAGGDCTLRAQCARHQAYERAQEDERAHYTTANLGAIRREGSCSLYEEGRRQRLAWGISRLYDELRAPDARWIRQVLQSYLGRGVYYHVRQLRRALTPEEQEYIRELFDERGYTDLPLVFDRYEEVYTSLTRITDRRRRRH